MKFFSWAHYKRLLYSSHSPQNSQFNAGKLCELIKRQTLLCNELPEAQAKASRDTHAEVLTIGTLGMGNLLTLSNTEANAADHDDGNNEEGEEEEQEEEEEEEEEAEEEARARHEMAEHRQPWQLSLGELSPSCHASTSSNRQSVSSNCESVSLVDIQTLQEELQRILYFKLGQEDRQPPCKSKGGGKAKARKRKEQGNNGGGGHNNNNYNTHDHIKSSKQSIMNGSDGRRSSATSEAWRGSLRGLLPLHNFLEMPMDTLTATTNTSSSHTNKGESGPSSKLLNKRHYALLLQSLKSKMLHSSAPTHVNIPAPLFESLVKPKVKQHYSALPQHVSAVDKALHLLRRIIKRGPSGWRRCSTKEENSHEKIHACCDCNEEEESIKWAIARSHRGSERFINYITNMLAHIDKNDNSLLDNPHRDCNSNYDQQFEEDNEHMQVRLSTSTSLANEYWIDTDDEYLVLEL